MFVIKNIQDWKNSKKLLQLRLLKKIVNLSVLLEKIREINTLYSEGTTRISEKIFELEKEVEDFLMGQMNSDWASNQIYEQMQKTINISKTS
jgi:hypothetical protein